MHYVTQRSSAAGSAPAALKHFKFTLSGEDERRFDTSAFTDSLLMFAVLVGFAGLQLI